jgi:hypothetical protein
LVQGSVENAELSNLTHDYAEHFDKRNFFHQEDHEYFRAKLLPCVSFCQGAALEISASNPRIDSAFGDGPFQFANQGFYSKVSELK